jgi:flagellar biosynthesis/type III secretory pathway chaperone
MDNWQELHNALRDDLQKEVHLTRELLSNMHQEEVSLMLHDAGSLNALLQQRSHLMEKLSSLRTHRREMTEQIEKIAGAATLDKILPPNEEITMEILSLSDQLMALTEKISRQSTQNQYVAAHGDHYSYPQPLPAEARPKRKAAVATYQIKK